MGISSRVRVTEHAVVWPRNVIYIRIGHVDDVSGTAITCCSELSASHIRRRERGLAVVDFAVEANVVRTSGEGRICRVRAHAAKERARIVSDPAILDRKPPVVLEQ